MGIILLNFKCSEFHTVAILMSLYNVHSTEQGFFYTVDAGNALQ